MCIYVDSLLGIYILYSIYLHYIYRYIDIMCRNHAYVPTTATRALVHKPDCLAVD